MSLHPTLEAAARGELPEWSQAGKSRRKHMGRVADVLESWARALPHQKPGRGGRKGGRSRSSSADEPLRWRAAGFLHDVLRDGVPRELRKLGGRRLDRFADGVVHGPAAALRLRADGVEDEDFLRAVAYHTIGHPEFEALGRALYAADFLEPGRPYRRKWRKALRVRMPDEAGSVVREVARAKMAKLFDDFQPLPEETREFWNVLVSETDA
jgi:2-amino-4-hydroxy-6-hydroxymethyldihydropteridine diphosphokinase